MGRTVRDSKMDTRAARLRLSARAEPYWRVINEGAHIGYYRGARVGKWVARFRQPGATSGGYSKATLGEADDTSDANGTDILDWRQAQEAAQRWFNEIGRGVVKRAPYKVGDALDDYMAGFVGKSFTATRSRVEAIVRPAFGDIELHNLTTKHIVEWHRDRAASPARLRTSKTAVVPNVRALNGDEGVRRRRSTANRDLTVLKAALNKAFRDGKIDTDEAWRKVTPFAKVDGSKMRYLSDDEARRLVNACNTAFRPMVQAALLTGARYGELCGAKVQDFDSQSSTLWLTNTKAGKPRAVYLEAEGVRLLSAFAAKRPEGALLFTRPDGKGWSASQQARPLATACANAKIYPAAGFHDLRRTYGARMALQGVPMAVIAEALGHADERITRKHYAHLSPSYVAETVRKHAGGLGIVAESKVAARTCAAIAA